MATLCEFRWCKHSREYFISPRLPLTLQTFKFSQPHPVFETVYVAYLLTCPTAMQIYWNRRKCLHKKKVELPQDWFGTPTWAHQYGCHDVLCIRSLRDTRAPLTRFSLTRVSWRLSILANKHKNKSVTLR